MKKSFFSITFAVVTVAFAANDPVMTPTGHVGRPGLAGFRNPQTLARRAGGFVERVLPGADFVFADARSNGDDMAAVCKKITESAFIRAVRKPCTLKAGADPVQIARELLKDPSKVGAVAVVYEGGKDDPVLMSLPENRIAVLNVTPLREGADEAKYQDRLTKELWRVFAFAAGGLNSSTPYCVMQTVLKPSDLDDIQCIMASPFVTGSVNDSAQKYGFARVRRATYRQACREGWAPAPTNKYQKAIWEKIKADKERGPSNPIKIPMPSKKK